MIGLDTSVVVRLLIGEPAAQAAAALTYLDKLFEEGERAFVSDLVVSETYFALQYHYQVPKQEALEALRALIDSGEFMSLGVAEEVLATPDLASAKPGFVDRLIHRQYQKFPDGGMATFERKAAKLSATVVLKSD